MTSARELRARFEEAKASGDRALAAELGRQLVVADGDEFQQRHQPVDRYELAAHRILAQLAPEARRVMEQTGRHYTELAATTRDLAVQDDDAQRDRESSHAIMSVQAARAGASAAWSARQRMEQARRDAPERWPGREQMAADEQEQWAAQAWPDHMPEQRAAVEGQVQ